MVTVINLLISLQGVEQVALEVVQLGYIPVQLAHSVDEGRLLIAEPIHLLFRSSCLQNDPNFSFSYRYCSVVDTKLGDLVQQHCTAMPYCRRARAEENFKLLQRQLQRLLCPKLQRI